MITHKCRPVIIESKNPNATIIKNIDTNYLVRVEKWSGNHIPVELILISLDDKIEIRDRFIDSEGILRICTEIKYDIGIIRWNEGSDIICSCKKVIATQSQISSEYINTFINEYNIGDIKNVDVLGEMCAMYGKALLPCSPYNNETNSDMSIYRFYPTLDNNGFVTIIKKNDCGKCVKDCKKVSTKTGKYGSCKDYHDTQILKNESLLKEILLCKSNPYYFATKYLTVNGNKFVTNLNEQEFNKYINDYESKLD